MKENIRSFITFAIPIVAIAFLLAFNPKNTQNKRENPYGEITTYSDKFTEVKTEVIKEGEGEETIATGDSVTVQYKGWLASSGKVFDQSTNGYPFTVGTGVIDGWSEAIVGMKKGEIRRFLIPAEKGYKEAGSGEVIPPNADLVFVVEVEEITKATAAQ